MIKGYLDNQPSGMSVVESILESISDGFCYVDNDWKVLYWNSAAEKILNRPKAEVLGHNLWQVFPEAVNTIFHCEYLRSKQQNVATELEQYYEPNDLWVRVKTYPSENGLSIFLEDMTARKKLSETVSYQKNQQEAIINASSDAIWSIDRNGCLLAANSTFRQNIRLYTGLSIDIGDCVLDLGDEAESQKWRELYGRALNGETVVQEDFIEFPASGQAHYIELTLNPIKDGADMQIVGVAGHSHDITAVKMQMKEIEEKNRILEEKERLLQESTDKLQAIIHSSPDIIATVDANGYYTSVSDSVISILGLEPEDMEGRHFSNFVSPADLLKTEDVTAGITDGNNITAFKNRLVAKDGRLVHILWSARWDVEKRTMFCVGRDATALHEAELKRELAERRFMALINKGADMVGIIDERGAYKFISNNVSQIFGYTSEELLGQNALDFIHKEDIERAKSELANVATSKELKLHEFRFKDRDNRWHWVETICTNMLNDEVVQGIIVNSRDVTERKKNQRKLKKAMAHLTEQNRVLREIAFIQSHEVRRPLANIMGIVDILINTSLNSHETTPYLDTLQTNALELDCIIHKIVEKTYSIAS
ncbi:MAG: PAS domain S-box protein [Sphingobacteriales bacterium]|nr:MAG: PAS domain S-box protein [Sphingobacteriales bacterium]